MTCIYLLTRPQLPGARMGFDQDNANRCVATQSCELWAKLPVIDPMAEVPQSIVCRLVKQWNGADTRSPSCSQRENCGTTRRNQDHGPRSGRQARILPRRVEQRVGEFRTDGTATGAGV